MHLACSVVEKVGVSAVKLAVVIVTGKTVIFSRRLYAEVFSRAVTGQAVTV